MKTISIDSGDTLDLNSIPEITSIKQRKPLMKTLIFVGLAIVAFYMAYITDSSNSNLITFFAFIAVSLLIVALVGMLGSCTVSFYLKKQNPIKAKSYEFDSTQKSVGVELSEVLNDERLKEMVKNNQGKIKMELLLSRDEQFLACQLFRFVPYKYEVLSDIYCLYGDEAKEFVNKASGLGLKIR